MNGGDRRRAPVPRRPVVSWVVAWAGLLAVVVSSVAGCGGPGRAQPSVSSSRAVPGATSAPSVGRVAADPPPAGASRRPGAGRGTAGSDPGAEIEEPGPVTGRLRVRPDGVVLLAGRDTSMEDASGPVSPVEGSASRRWTPSASLPSPELAGRHVDIFYSPHPDDETLSMGVLIATAVRRGDRVIVATLTDGRTTGAVRAIDAKLAALASGPVPGATPHRTARRRPGRTGASAGPLNRAPLGSATAGPRGTATATGSGAPLGSATAAPRGAATATGSGAPLGSATAGPRGTAIGAATAAVIGAPTAAASGTTVRVPSAGLTPDDIAAARVGELRRATTDLGVPWPDVFLAHLDAPDSDGAARATVSEVEQVMRAFAERFPGATHVTMSDVVERQLDHLDAGVALRRLLDTGVVGSAEWAVSRLYWPKPTPAWTWALPDAVTRARVRRAALEYLMWRPDRGEYAIGFHSVRWQFAALSRDVRDRVHGTGPLRPGL